MALQGRQPRPQSRVQLAVDAADGRRRRLLDGGLAPRGRRARRRQRRAAVGPPARRRRARPGRAAAALGPRARVLEERRRRANHLRDAGLSDDRARRAHRRARRAASATTASSISSRTIDQDVDPLDGEIGLHATPIVAKDVVIVGAAHRDRREPEEHAQRRRATCAASTCAPASGSGSSTRFRSRGEFGTESWLAGSAEYTGNTGVWAQISVDEELETVYLPVEQPTGDYFGANRPGDNLFGETLLAVDLYTGERKWHYQLVHHGIWDYDIPCAPILIDVDGRRQTREGRRAADEAGVPVRLRSRDGRAGLADRGAARAARATCPASGTRRRSRSRRSRRPTTGRA